MSARPALAAWRKPGLFLERRLAAALGWALGRWVRVRAHPDGFAASLDRGLPTVYVLQLAQLSSLLVLQREAATAGLPDPLAPLVTESPHQRRAQLHLGRVRRPALPLVRRPSRPPARLRRLVAACLADPDLEVQLVRIVMHGRGTMLASGFPIEFFVEGGRSRTGRLLEPPPLQSSLRSVSTNS